MTAQSSASRRASARPPRRGRLGLRLRGVLDNRILLSRELAYSFGT
jgi:hypothetical protein